VEYLRVLRAMRKRRFVRGHGATHMVCGVGVVMLHKKHRVQLDVVARRRNMCLITRRASAGYGVLLLGWWDILATDKASCRRKQGELAP